MQMLYSLSFNQISQAQEILEDSFTENLIENLMETKGKVKKFIVDTFNGVVQNIEAIDKEIAKHLIDWDFNRIAKVDLMVLRIATYEIKYVEDMPIKIAISEAIEIADEYSTDKSSKFVNGVLASINNEIIKTQELSNG